MKFGSIVINNRSIRIRNLRFFHENIVTMLEASYFQIDLSYCQGQFLNTRSQSPVVLVILINEMHLHWTIKWII